MPSTNDHDAARLLDACRMGFHDLSNQLVALYGLLQLLQLEETDRLSSLGQYHVRLLLGVIHDAQALTRTLKAIVRLGDSTPPASVKALPELLKKGLDRGLPNQLNVLHGLLQMLHPEETDRLSSDGQDYVRRLVRVMDRAQALTRTLKAIVRLGDSTPPASVVMLPELLDEVLAEWPSPPACTVVWDAPRVTAPRQLLHQAVAQALRLFLEMCAGEPAYLDLSSRPAQAGVELALAVNSVATAPLAATLARWPAALASAWHDRVECVLLRQLADGWGGSVRWQKDSNRLTVTLTLLDTP